MKKSILTLIFMCIGIMSYAQQQRTIYLHVQGEDGYPIPGATIMVKGTQYGTTTDIWGNATLFVPSNATYLIVSYLGYETQEVEIQPTILVRLKEDTTIQDTEIINNSQCKLDFLHPYS